MVGSGALRASRPIAQAIGIFAILLGSTVSAQPARRIEDVERERGQATQTARRLRAEAEANAREIARLDQRLAEAGERRAEAETQAAEAEQRLAQLRSLAVQERASRNAHRDALEAALIAAAFAERRGLEPNRRRAGLLAAALAPDLGRGFTRSTAALAETERLQQEIAAEQTQLAEAQAAIEAERTGVESMIAQRRALRTTQMADAQAAQQRAQRLSREARSLRELAERAAASRSARAAAPRPGVLPASWTAPAQGRLANGFGDRSQGGAPSQGASVRTRTGAQVLAPAAGEVAYSGLFRSYGQVLILNVDGGYAIVLAGMDSVRARTGERVTAGQLIGEMSTSATPAPELYVEVRRNGRAINPGDWLIARGVAQQVAER